MDEWASCGVVLLLLLIIIIIIIINNNNNLPAAFLASRFAWYSCKTSKASRFVHRCFSGIQGLLGRRLFFGGLSEVFWLPSALSFAPVPALLFIPTDKRPVRIGIRAGRRRFVHTRWIV